MDTNHIPLISIYLISRIHSTFHKHHISLCDQLMTNDKSSSFSIFIPHLYNPTTILPKHIESNVFLQDLNEMLKCKVGIISFPIGKDCSAEIGWFHGHSKKCVGIVWDSGYGLSCNEQYKNIESDWMVKGFLHSLIVIGCNDTYRLIKSTDSILKDKVYFLHSFESICSLLQV
jgi:hypothetical protein